MKAIIVVLLCSLTVVFGARLSSRYDLIEHKHLGGGDLDEKDPDPLILIDPNAKTATNTQGSIKKGFSFGDMTAFAGDFFGPTTFKKIICMGNSIATNPDSIVSRFREVKSAIIAKAGDKKFADLYYKQLEEESKAIGFDGKNPKSPAYDNGEMSKKIGDVQWQLKYLIYKAERDMLTNNDDHFGECAQHTIKAVVQSWFDDKKVTKAGPKLGQQRKKADKPLTVLKKTEKAQDKYVDPDMRNEMAIISHFWTDQLAGGHVRTPRNALRQLCGDKAGGFMTNSMHNEDNTNGVPVRCTLPFRTPEGIIQQEQSITVRGDANFWTKGNEEKDRLIGFWRYVDKEMLAEMDVNKITPVWNKEVDEQTCPMLFVGGPEYIHDPKTGKFDEKEPEVLMRLNFMPLQCGLSEALSTVFFTSKSDVKEIKLKDKCCYLTKFEKEYCSYSLPALVNKGRNTGLGEGNEQGQIQKKSPSSKKGGSEGGSGEETEASMKEEGEVESKQSEGPDKRHISSWWDWMMGRIRVLKRTERKHLAKLQNTLFTE